jgi:hypothetical protein
VLAAPDTRIHVLQRAVELGAPSDAGNRVLAELRTAVAADLGSLALSGGITLEHLAAQPGSPLLDELTRAARHRVLADLEIAYGALGDRIRAGDALPVIDEWRAFLALRDAYQRAAAAGGLDVRRLAFPHAYLELLALAVHLWNERRQYDASHAVTHWLYAEALAVGDAEAIELLASNGRLSIPSR